MFAAPPAQPLELPNGLAMLTHAAHRSCWRTMIFYTLGFYVSDEPDNKWHTLKASVKRPGVELRYRKGYLAEPSARTPTLWTNEMALAAVSDPVGSSAAQLTAYCGPSPDDEAGTLVANLQIEAGSLRFQTEGANLQARLQVLFAERGPSGSTRLMSDAPTIKTPTQNWDAAQQEGLRYSRRTFRSRTFLPPASSLMPLTMPRSAAG